MQAAGSNAIPLLLDGDEANALGPHLLQSLGTVVPYALPLRAAAETVAVVAASALSPLAQPAEPRTNDALLAQGSHTARMGAAAAAAVHPRWHVLHAQQLQLERFARFHALAVTRTVDNAELLARAHAQLTVNESPLSPGLLGVFAACDLPLSFRCPYPGVLLSPRLHDDLHARCHVPTAVQLGSERVLVGDPCAPACLVNGVLVSKQRSKTLSQTASGLALAAEADPSLQRCVRSRLRTRRRHTSHSAITPTVTANIAFAWEEMDPTVPSSLCIRPTRPIAAGEELLLDYGRSFWRRQQHAPSHCQVCQSRDCSVLNVLFLCDGTREDGQACGVGQHELCFARASELPARGSSKSASWYCEQHASSDPSSQQIPRDTARKMPLPPLFWSPLSTECSV